MKTSAGNIFIGARALDAFSNFCSSKKHSTVFVVTDTNTSRDSLPVLKKLSSAISFREIILGAGEDYKSLQSVEKICETLLDGKANRETLLVNLGGGMVCDTGGFAASIYKRGITYINIPTTLLSMVDASIGGKTGVNLSGVKNAVGSFRRPEAVFIYPDFLHTLDPRQKNSGWGEIIKHLLIADPAGLSEFVNSTDKDFPPVTEEVIDQSVRIKLEIVNEDFKESGRRKTLNLGHTLAHAFESASFLPGASDLLHGEAVAAGLIGECFLSKKHCSFPANLFHKLTECIAGKFSSITISDDFTRLIEFMQDDKKNLDSKVAFSLLNDAGNPAGIISLTEEEILPALNFTKSVFN